MRDLGFDAVVTLSLADPGFRTGFGPPADIRRGPIGPRNPLSLEHSGLRTTLLGCLLDAARYNLARGAERVALFESGRAYLAEGSSPTPVARAVRRRRRPSLRAASDRGARGGPLRAAQLARRAAARRLLRAQGPPRGARGPARRGRSRSSPRAQPFLTRAVAARLLLGGREAGWLGEVHPLVAASGTWRRGRGFEVHLAELVAASPIGARGVRGRHHVPAVHQDLAIVVDDDVPAARGPRGRAGGRRRVAARRRPLRPLPRRAGRRGSQEPRAPTQFRAPDRTLTDEEVAEQRRGDQGGPGAGSEGPSVSRPESRRCSCGRLRLRRCARRRAGPCRTRGLELAARRRGEAGNGWTRSTRSYRVAAPGGARPRRAGRSTPRSSPIRTGPRRRSSPSFAGAGSRSSTSRPTSGSRPDTYERLRRARRARAAGRGGLRAAGASPRAGSPGPSWSPTRAATRRPRCSRSRRWPRRPDRRRGHRRRVRRLRRRAGAPRRDGYFVNVDDDAGRTRSAGTGTRRRSTRSCAPRRAATGQADLRAAPDAARPGLLVSCYVAAREVDGGRAGSLYEDATATSHSSRWSRRRPASGRPRHQCLPGLVALDGRPAGRWCSPRSTTSGRAPPGRRSRT